MRKTVLLCYPRSGSNFTTEIIKFLSAHSTLADLEGRDEKLREPPFNFDKHTADAVVREALFEEKFIKLHGQDAQHRKILNSWLEPGDSPRLRPWPPDLREAIAAIPANVPIPHDPMNLNHAPPQTEERTFLLLLLRHPAETFRSHRTVGNAMTGCPSADYFNENLKTYDSYSGPKSVIYYEDLVEDPDKYVRELCILFGIPFEVGDMFMADYDEHFNSCRKSYIEKHGGTRTNGKISKTQIEHRAQVWKAFHERCEILNVGSAITLCARYYEQESP